MKPTLPTFTMSLLLALVVAAPALAASYPTNVCVGSKQKEAAKYCKSVLKAWGVWDTSQSDTARDTQLAAAASKLDLRWGMADARATAAGVDCAETTLSSSAAGALIDGAAAGIVAAVNTGLDLGDPNDGACGGKLLKAAAVKCLKVLKAESLWVKKLAKDPDGTARAAALQKASDKFSLLWSTTVSNGCPTTATEGDIEARVDDIREAIVRDTTVSPSVDDTQFTTISPTGTTQYLGRGYTPTCVFKTPYHFFAKRGSVNKLLMYYQGGGACWEQLTCLVPVCDSNVNPAGGDNPNSFTSGFADLTNPANPFRDWNVVFVSYCSCDVHFGDVAQSYDNFNPASPLDVEHRGFQNAKVAEKWAREHFVNPEAIFVTGSSAGAYGAVFHAPLLHQVWPASEFRVLADAGNGVITPDFLHNEFANWNFVANLPPEIPGVLESITTGSGMPGYMEAVADYFPETNWANYTTAFDGGSGGQTGFYNVMLNGNDPLAALSWWNGSCAFNTVMRQQAADTFAAVTAANDNYRYYIGTGSRHTMWGSDKVYTDITGSVPTIVDWIDAMLTSGPGWTNVEASPFNVLLSGDPKPSTIPTPPFEQSGADVVVNCSPSGAFLDGTGGLLD
jgi:hypothetical protein